MKTQDVRQLFTLMVDSLRLSIGNPEMQLKLISHFACATHGVGKGTQPLINKFGILVLQGAGGLGKSTCMEVIANFCHKPIQFSMEGGTLPSLRDCMADARLGTILIEEADDTWALESLKKAESLVNSRYSVNTEKATLKQQTSVESKSRGGRKETRIINETMERKIYGCTVVHKRRQWRDANLHGKSIPILFRFNPHRDASAYEPFDPANVLNREGREITENGTAEIELPNVIPPSGIFGRTWETWKPIVQVAALIKDSEFDSWLRKTMVSESKLATTSRSEETESVVLNAVIRHVFDTAPATQLCNFDPVRLSVIVADLRDQRIDINPFQVGKTLREMGFTVYNSHGHIYLSPAAISLLAACDTISIPEDEGITELRKLVPTDETTKKKKENTARGGVGENRSTLSLSGKDLAAGEKERIQ